MLFEDKAFDLLFDSAENLACDQSAALSDFVRRSLSRKYPPFRESAAAPSWPTPSADGVAPVATACNVLVFDIPALIHCKNLFKSAILSPRSVARHLSRRSDQSAAGQIGALHDIQQSLHCTDSVFVFDPNHVAPLMALGARAPVQLATPALQRVPHQPHPADLLIINHCADQVILTEVLGFIGAGSGISVAVVDPADPPTTGETPPDGIVHLHIGTNLAHLGAWRIVDSYAQRRLVVHLLDLNSAIGETVAMQSQMRVDHNRSGLRISDAGAAIAAAKRLLADPAIADLFRRNGDRFVALFNAGIEDELLDGLR